MLASVWACEWNRSWWHICEGGFHSELQDFQNRLSALLCISSQGILHLSGWGQMFPAHVSGAILCTAEDISSVQWAREGSGSGGHDQADLWKLSSLPRCVPFQYPNSWHCLTHCMYSTTSQYMHREQDESELEDTGEFREMHNSLSIWALKNGPLSIKINAFETPSPLHREEMVWLH